MRHKHHITPKHMGGTDGPSNLVTLTIEEHAEAHRILFEHHGHWQDEVAWKTLSGQIIKAEAIKLTQKAPKSEDLGVLYTTNPTVKCFVAWHNNARRKFIMSARLSSKAKFPPQRGILY